MDMGIDFSKILVILILILVFFGSKELPRFLREGARLLAKVRRYSDKVKQEINSITSTLDVPNEPSSNMAAVGKSKQELRKKILALRRAADPRERSEKSKIICSHLMNLEEFKNAHAVMIYVTMGSEVETRPLIEQMLRMGKRVVLPYCKSEAGNLGIGEITDLEKDIIIGPRKAPEPRPELRDRFFRSDVQLIVCPGIAFDLLGGRLGRGMGNYDNFLRELKGKIPMIGLAFDFQMLPEQLPFSYNDVSMNQIITESGYKISSGIGGAEASKPEESPASGASVGPAG
jgi:5-formyltetrahydrofolate cyclo-ligase